MCWFVFRQVQLLPLILAHDCSHCLESNSVKFNQSFLSRGKYLLFKAVISEVFQSRVRPIVRFLNVDFRRISCGRGYCLSCGERQWIQGSNRKCLRGDCRIKSTRWASLPRTNRDFNLGVKCIPSKIVSVMLGVRLVWLD